MYTALYMPMRDENEPDPSCSGFETVEQAEEYIFDRMCGVCKRSRARALAGDSGEEDEFVSEYPSCFAEWLVVPDDAVNLPFDEMMEAAGWKQIPIPQVDEDTKG